MRLPLFETELFLELRFPLLLQSSLAAACELDLKFKLMFWFCTFIAAYVSDVYLSFALFKFQYRIGCLFKQKSCSMARNSFFQKKKKNTVLLFFESKKEEGTPVKKE